MTHKEKKKHNTLFFSSPSFCLIIMELHIHQTAVFYYKDGTPEVQPVVKKKKWFLQFMLLSFFLSYIKWNMKIFL